MGNFCSRKKNDAMHTFTLGLVLGLLSSSVLAAPKPCDELRAVIDVKIQAAGVVSYTLEVVPNEDAQNPNMVVGSCNGGSKKIIYQKTS
jgi:hypothetical protein